MPDPFSSFVTGSTPLPSCLPRVRYHLRSNSLLRTGNEFGIILFRAFPASRSGLFAGHCLSGKRYPENSFKASPAFIRPAGRISGLSTSYFSWLPFSGKESESFLIVSSTAASSCFCSCSIICCAWVSPGFLSIHRRSRAMASAGRLYRS